MSMWVQLHGEGRRGPVNVWPRKPWSPSGYWPLEWEGLDRNVTLTHVSVWDDPMEGHCWFDGIALDRQHRIKKNGTFHLTNLNIQMDLR